MAWLSLVHPGSTYLTAIALPMILIGAGQGLAFAPLTSAGISGVQAEDAGAASGLVNTAHQLGSALGLGILVAVSAGAGSLCRRRYNGTHRSRINGSYRRHRPARRLSRHRPRTDRPGYENAKYRKSNSTRRKEAEMSHSWTEAELTKIGDAEELQISSYRRDGTARPYVTIWVVRTDNQLYVRSAYGTDNPWFVRATASGTGRIRAGGIERDVAFESAAPDAHIVDRLRLSHQVRPLRPADRRLRHRPRRRTQHHSTCSADAELNRPFRFRGDLMEILKPQPTSKAPSDWFTGDVWWDVIYAGQEPSRMRANMVRFAPCARTDWHSHAVGQTLHIVSGTALVQARGGEIVEVHPGETVYTPAGEEHWHGAAPDRFMSHLALWEGPGDGGTETTWGDKVTDEEYGGPRAKRR